MLDRNYREMDSDLHTTSVVPHKSGVVRSDSIGKRVLSSSTKESGRALGNVVLGKRNWQITSAGLMLLSLILALGIVWMSAQSKV